MSPSVNLPIMWPTHVMLSTQVNVFLKEMLYSSSCLLIRESRSLVNVSRDTKKVYSLDHYQFTEIPKVSFYQHRRALWSY